MGPLKPILSQMSMDDLARMDDLQLSTSRLWRVDEQGYPINWYAFKYAHRPFSAPLKRRSWALR